MSKFLKSNLLPENTSNADCDDQVDVPDKQLTRNACRGPQEDVANDNETIIRRLGPKLLKEINVS